jgi:carbonic anhydrase
MGIAMGMVVALGSILRRNFLGSFEVSIEDTESDNHTHMVTVKLADEVSFLSRASIVDAFTKIPDGSFVRFDLSENRHMDADIEELIEEFKVNADYRNITVE